MKGLFLATVAVLSAELALSVPEARAETITIPYDVSITYTMSRDAQWSISASIPGFGGGSSFQAIFPTKHNVTFSAYLPFVIDITYPGVVSPGETVQIETSITPGAHPSVGFSSALSYDFGFGIATDQGTIPLADASSFAALPVNPLQGLLTGSGTWSADGDARPRPLSIYMSSFDTDFFGGEPAAPRNTATTVGYAFSTSQEVQAWQVPSTRILDTMGSALPGPVSLISALYDVKVEADYDIQETAWVGTNLISGYYTYDGIGGYGYDVLALNGPAKYRTITVPTDIGLADGDSFDVNLFGLGADLYSYLGYSVDGYGEYKAVTLFGLVELGGPEDVKDGEGIDSWEYTLRHYAALQDVTLSFQISDPSAPPASEPATLFLLAAGLVGVARHRTRIRRS